MKRAANLGWLILAVALVAAGTPGNAGPAAAPSPRPPAKAQPPKDKGDAFIWFGSLFQPPPLDISWTIMTAVGVPDGPMTQIRAEYETYSARSVSLDWNYLNALKAYGDAARANPPQPKKVEDSIQKITAAERDLVAAGVAFWKKADALMGEQSPQFLAAYGAIAERSIKSRGLPTPVWLFAPPPEGAWGDIVQNLGLTPEQVTKLQPLGPKYAPRFEQFMKVYPAKLGEFFGILGDGYPLPWDKLQAKSNEVIDAEADGLKLEAGLWSEISSAVLEGQMNVLWQGLMGDRTKVLLATKFGALPPAEG